MLLLELSAATVPEFKPEPDIVARPLPPACVAAGQMMGVGDTLAD